MLCKCVDYDCHLQMIDFMGQHQHPGHGGGNGGDGDAGAFNAI